MTLPASPRFSGLPRHDGSVPVIRVYQIPRPAIQYFTSLTEASDGIGLVRTLDESRGIVECWMMPDFLTQFERLIESIGEEWSIQPLDSEFE